MPETLNVVPGMPDWLTTAEVAKLLGKNVRTIQEWAKDGKLRTKSAQNRNNPGQRLYDAKDVARIIAATPARSRPQRSPVALSRTKAKPTQEERALDTVSMAGQFLAYLKGEKEADREREKAEREDKREQWEADHKIKLMEMERRHAAEQRDRDISVPWLTIKAAVEMSGMTRKAIVALCEAGTIVALNEGGWRINRASLAATFDGAPLTRLKAVPPPPTPKARRAHA